MITTTYNHDKELDIKLTRIVVTGDIRGYKVELWHAKDSERPYYIVWYTTKEHVTNALNIVQVVLNMLEEDIPEIIWIQQ